MRIFFRVNPIRSLLLHPENGGLIHQPRYYYPTPPHIYLSLVGRPGIDSLKISSYLEKWGIHMFHTSPRNTDIHQQGQERMGKPNHLVHEKSPYLAKHAYNPVDWFPWGEEGIEKARKEDKPILLSIGYSTCHWCNVMENESFSDPDVAAVMNRHLVNIKLDREERPDLDKIYITAVSALTGSAGWPLNVFLTPDLKPFFGGTYFPPKARMGIPGWVDLIEEIGRAWKNPERRDQIISSSREITSSLKSFLTGSGSPGEIKEPAIHTGFDMINSSFDFRYGGFSSAPKFPVSVIHSFLLRYHVYTKNIQRKKEKSTTALDISLHSLKKMADGGIFDHLGGGFHRYSTDEKWHLPHFEKMLYDNSQLARIYLDAFQLTKEANFAKVARRTLGYILRELTNEEGGFLSAEDADSLPPELSDRFDPEDMEHKKEGAFYVWTRDEVIERLGNERGELFCFRFGLEHEGNVRYDPMSEFIGKNVLSVARSISETGGEFNRSDEEVEAFLEMSIEELFSARSLRPKPHLDDKVIASWNGLTISAFAIAYQVLGENEYLEAAKRGAAFIEEHLYDQENGQLFRRWRDGQRKIKGMADDYSFMTQGLLDLYEASLDVRHLKRAISLADESISRFYDDAHGGFYMTEKEHDAHLIMRSKEDFDSVEPSPSSVATMNLLRLHRYTENRRFMEVAERTLKYCSPILERHAGSAPYMLSSLMLYLSPPTHVVIVGDLTEEGTAEILEAVRSRFIPSHMIILLDSEPTKQAVGNNLPFVKDMEKIDGKPTAYVCVNYSCRNPTNDPEVVKELLEAPVKGV